MTVTTDMQIRRSSSGALSAMCLEDKFEVLKDIGDGSFGSVVLARVRTAGSHIARRGSVVAIKTMKKTFESFAPCLELREVIFLRSLPIHPHLVPALDIFLDPLTKKLHICMEYMDGNLYQLMKSRDHKSLDGASVKSILFQILSGLDHIHAHKFFHRDIKPENILVSSSAPHESGITFRRYSALVTPPSTPPMYTVKIADFGLARETHSQHPYTTYVSTRWYRAPEVLLRAGEYSAPVDIWAVGAMAVEIANLKPLFPGGNEVDQVWRVCEVMGSPGNWLDKSGHPVGGGEWRDGTRLAHKLGFSFPKMAPHAMDTILRPPQWPIALSNLVTWCLMWDPQNRPTSGQAMNHEYFVDAVDPMRPKPSTTRLLGRKHSAIESKSNRDSNEPPNLTSKPSWFKKTLITRESAPAVPQHPVKSRTESPATTAEHQIKSGQLNTPETTPTAKSRPAAAKRATWTNGMTPLVGAPMPILPSIRPISPFSDSVTAQAHRRTSNHDPSKIAESTSRESTKASKKVGRQLSVASHGNHYADAHRSDAERASNGNRDSMSPNGYQKEGFFSHLRKRARRLSGRPQAPLSPNSDDLEATAGCGPWPSNRSSMVLDSTTMETAMKKNLADTDKNLPHGRYVGEVSPSPNVSQRPKGSSAHLTSGAAIGSERHHSIPTGQAPRALETISALNAASGPVSSRTRRALHMSTQPAQIYETPDEKDELRHDAVDGPSLAAIHKDRCRRVESDKYSPTQNNKNGLRYSSQLAVNSEVMLNPYPTPSPSAKRNGVLFNSSLAVEHTPPLNIPQLARKDEVHSKWPTPPYEENEWGAAAAASIFAASSVFQ